MTLYITNYNFDLLQNLFVGKDYSNIDMNEEIIKIDKRWFNRLEKATMITAKKLYLTPEDLAVTIEKISVKDSGIYINKSSNPAYHLDSDCERLNSDFKGYKFPKELKEEEREKFRNFFNSLLSLDEKTTPYKIKLKIYQEKYPNLSYPELVQYPNSGVETIEKKTLRDVENSLDILIEEANIFYAKNIKTLYRFETKSFLHKDSNFRKEIGEAAAEILKEFQQRKDAIKNQVIEYYRFVNAMNGKINASKDVLSLAGFSPCSRCGK